jgi:hypothetical protein
MVAMKIKKDAQGRYSIKTIIYGREAHFDHSTKSIGEHCNSQQLLQAGKCHAHFHNWANARFCWYMECHSGGMETFY